MPNSSAKLTLRLIRWGSPAASMSSPHQNRMLSITYESLVRAFRYFGGCVKTVLVDNQKAAVLKNNNGKVMFNSGFLLLADHYNFLPRACRPRRARTKGKVERMVKYLKENFFVRYRRFDSFTHVNQQLEQWIADVADKRELRQFKETPEQRASRWSRNICSRYRIRTSIPVTSTSAMCPRTAISRLVVIVTAFPKRCVVSQYRYEYRWMTSCGSTVMKTGGLTSPLFGIVWLADGAGITPRSGSRSVRWNIDH